MTRDVCVRNRELSDLTCMAAGEIYHRHTNREKERESEGESTREMYITERGRGLRERGRVDREQEKE